MPALVSKRSSRELFRGQTDGNSQGHNERDIFDEDETRQILTFCKNVVGTLLRRARFRIFTFEPATALSRWETQDYFKRWWVSTTKGHKKKANFDISGRETETSKY